MDQHMLHCVEVLRVMFARLHVLGGLTLMRVALYPHHSFWFWVLGFDRLTADVLASTKQG